VESDFLGADLDPGAASIIGSNSPPDLITAPTFEYCPRVQVFEAAIHLMAAAANEGMLHVHATC
jgi:hypothetical protein